ncbi:Hint domain-containing protein [Pararhodobacter sp. CCB-MM2]|uniref:Hint domain-containing protein n=1 Tax=Pararhodobacter sp. CCB-MM2 TaxID=1786003 RepID=UPI000831230F|nr:Hint domain-containing protein [Pararhodobacter sp. CCB-MM2]
MPPRNDDTIAIAPQVLGIVEGTDGDDVLQVPYTDSEGDQFTDAGANVDGMGGNDTIYGGRGDDTLNGGAGSDWVFGGDGLDMLFGDAGNDTLWGDAGDDTLHGNEGDDKVIGGAGDDLIYGDEGDDLLIGDNNPGDGGGMSPEDPAEPGYGNDTLVTDSGNDTAKGGSGDDVFRVFDNFGNHLIIGGETGETEVGDTLDMNTVGEGLQVFYTGDEEGRIFRDGATMRFEEIEKTYLGTGDDRVEVLDATSGYVHGGYSYDRLVLPMDSQVDEVVITSEVPYDPVPGATSKTGYVLFKDGTRLDFESFEEIEKCVCFTPGTLIDTLRGRVAVEELQAGDKVLTRDHGYQPLSWTGRRDLSADELALVPSVAPIRIEAGALGRGLPERDLTVSPRHRMLITGPRAELMFGESEVLVAAGDMLGLPGVRQLSGEAVSYIHVMCEAHQIIRAEGAWTESFQPAAGVINALAEETRAELLAIFPELATEEGRAAYTAARPVLSGEEAKSLFVA